MGALAGAAGIAAIFIVLALLLGLASAVALKTEYDAPPDQRRQIPEDR
jgi:hypothetical protein